MRNTSVKFKPVSGTDNSFDLEAGAAPSKLATSLTLAAMSLDFRREVAFVTEDPHAVETIRELFQSIGAAPRGAASAHALISVTQ